MPIPYMGSKEKHGAKIFNAIVNNSPKFDTLIDLFCGGFAISELFIKAGYNVVANDKNKYVVALIDYMTSKNIDKKLMQEFVSREKFFDVTKNPNLYPDWYVGFIQCCWSFGNNQVNYLYGKDKEEIKRAGQDLVINLNTDLINKFLPKDVVLSIAKKKTIYQRRIALNRVAESISLKDLRQLQSLERLESLESLESLERLESLESLETYSLNYNEVPLKNNSVIYCDPPYKGTAEYKEDGFNHNEFWDWVRETCKSHLIFVSEYTAPPDFLKVLEFKRKSSFQQRGTQKHNKQPNECVYLHKSQFGKHKQVLF